MKLRTGPSLRWFLKVGGWVGYGALKVRSLRKCGYYCTL